MNLLQRVRDHFEAISVASKEDLNDESVQVEGLVHNFAFDPKALTEHREAYLALCEDLLSDHFKKSGGGGWSFLNLPMGKDGEQWGEQRDAEIFLCMGIAHGVAEYCAPKAMWSLLPGGVPYVAFDVKESPSAQD